MFTFFLFTFLINSHSGRLPFVKESTASFTILNAGFEIDGTVKVIRSAVKFDPKNLKESSISAVADPSTIETGISIRDKHLRRSDYFDVMKNPEIRLQSMAFRKAGHLKFIGGFDLTIKGITKRIEIPFTVKKDDSVTRYTAQFEINRLDFDLGEKSAILDDIVVVKVRIEE